METPRSPIPAMPGVPESVQEKPGFRTKTIATRITPEELRAVETAAERSGKSLAEWLRELALKASQDRPADPAELILAEVMALRYVLLNLFYASASAQSEGTYLTPESVVKFAMRWRLGSWPTPANCSPIFLAGEGGTGGQK